MGVIRIDSFPVAGALIAGSLLYTMVAQAQAPGPVAPSTAPALSRPPPLPDASVSAPGVEAKPDGAGASGADAGPVEALAWLGGCWHGTVNERDFREQWLPYRGGMLIGAGQQVMKDATQDYEFMRIDARPDGVHFTQFSGDRTEIAFKLASTTVDDKDTVFTFANVADAFPARLIYRRGTGGWLYETIEGPLNGVDKHVIYPMRRISCETGAILGK